MHYMIRLYDHHRNPNTNERDNLVGQLTHQVATAGECSQHCADDPKCFGWSHYAPGLRSRCWCSLDRIRIKCRSFPCFWTTAIYNVKCNGRFPQKWKSVITFDWSVLRRKGQRSWATFWKLFSGISHLPIIFCATCYLATWPPVTCHLEPEMQKRYASGVLLKRALKM